MLSHDCGLPEWLAGLYRFRSHMFLALNFVGPKEAPKNLKTADKHMCLRVYTHMQMIADAFC